MPRDPLPSEAPIANPYKPPVSAPVSAGPACQFITAERPATEANKCGLAVVWGSPYCYRHHRRCVRPPLPFGYLLQLAGLCEAGSQETGSPEAGWPEDPA